MHLPGETDNGEGRAEEERDCFCSVMQQKASILDEQGSVIVREATAQEGGGKTMAGWYRYCWGSSYKSAAGSLPRSRGGLDYSI